MVRSSAFSTYASEGSQVNGGAGVVNNVTMVGTQPTTNSSSGSTFTLTNAATNAQWLVPTTGLYEVTFEANIAKPLLGIDEEVVIWARTGTGFTAVPRSAIRQTVVKEHRVSVTSVFTINLATTTPLTFAWSSTGTEAFLEAVPAAGVIPLVPSFSVVLKQMTTSYRPENVWYVSKDSISNRPVDGGFETPYSTVAAAVAQAEAISTVPLVPQLIIVAPGLYNEGNITVNKGYFTIMGSGPASSVNGNTTIVANWNINITNATFDNLFANQIVFSNVTLSQSTGVATSIATVSDVSTKKHSLIFKNTQVYGRNVLLNFDPTAALDGRVFLEDAEFTQTAEAVPIGEIGDVIRHNVGAISMTRSNITAIKNTRCLLVNGSGAVYTMSLCNFQSVTADAAAFPIVQLQSSVSYPTGISLCGFFYSNGAAKNRLVSCGIKFGGTTGQQLVLNNCLFGLLGLGYDGYAVDVTGSAIHQVLNTGSASYPGTAYVINVPVSKLVTLAPLLGL